MNRGTHGYGIRWVCGLLALAIVLMGSSLASAQNAPATKWQLRFYLPGGAEPVLTQDLLGADTNCNIDRTVAQPQWSVRWEQPPDQGTCQWISPAGGVLQARPVGVAYTVGLAAINNDIDGPGPESDRVGFRLPALAPAPTGLSLRGGQ